MNPSGFPERSGNEQHFRPQESMDLHSVVFFSALSRVQSQLRKGGTICSGAPSSIHM
jgi:hypothetical protein